MKNFAIFSLFVCFCFLKLNSQTTYTYNYSTIGATEASTIQGHLNNGDNVIVTTTGTTTNLQVSSNILKSSGGNATLTIKSAFRVTMNVNTSIKSTSNKLNIVFWSNSTNNSATKGMIRFGDHTQPTANVIIETNGGHLWVGGGSNNTTWNGLTVGDGYAWGCASPGGNGWYGIELYGDCRFYTNGGNIAFKGRSTDLNNGWQGVSYGIYIIKSIVNAGSGNIDINSLTDGTGVASANTTGIAIAGDGGFTTSTGNINITNALDVASNSSGTATGVYLERNSTGNSSGNPVISSNQGSVNITTTMSTPASQKFFIDINELNFTRERASTAQQFTLPVRDLISGSSATYSSSLTSVATINNSGLVTLVGTGNTDITGTFTKSNWNSFNSRWRYKLSVLNKADPSLSFSQSNIYKDISDPSFAITATQANQTGTVGSITYSSSNRSVATVNSSTGQVTIVGQGSAVITANSANTATYVQGEASYMLYVTSGFVVLTTGLTKSLTKVNLSGNVTSSGGNTVTERGFVYGTSSNPTISNTKIVVGSGTGSFSTTTPDLADGTYNFRAYATNSSGTIYGSQFTEVINLSSLGCITIVSSGGVAEGTSSGAWSFSNNTIYPNSSTNLSINASDVLSKLSAGNVNISASCITINSAISHTSNSRNLNLTASGNIILAAAVTLNGAISINGGAIAVNENINTTSGGTNGDILLKANSNISLAASKSITTTGGDVIIWADQDVNSGGTISLSSASIQTSGGTIVLAGGLDNGSNSGTSNDGIPDGYARGVGVSGISTTGSFTINSGSGPIFMKGSSDNRDGISLSANSSSTGSIISSSGNVDLLGFVESGSIVNGQSGGFIQAGIRTSGGGTINIESNTGTLKIEGNAPRYGLAFGVSIFDGTNWFASDGSTQTIIKTANTSNNAITINGNGQHGISFRGLVSKIHATAALGGITLNAVSSSWTTTIYNPLEVLAVSGPINWQNSNSTDGIGVFSLGAISFGSKSGVSGLTSSSSNINIHIQRLTSGATPFSIATTGQVSILGINGTATFGQAFSTTTFGLNANSQTMTGFTFGSSTNTANITLGQSLTVAGPITAYGGTITIDGNLSSSNGSTISLFGNSLTFGSGITVTSSGQLVVAPQTASNTIGLGGATGTLSLPASYFSTNFSDGFSNIQIGSNAQTGDIAANTFTLRDNMTFLTSGSLTLTGRPALGSNNVTLGAGITTVNVGSPANYFQTNGTGTIIRNIASGTNRLFPAGNSAYNPVTITNNTGADDEFRLRVLDEVYQNGSSSGTVLTTPRVKRTWLIDKTNANAGSGINFVFNWNSGENTSGLNSPRLYHHDGTRWNKQTGTTSSTSTSLTYTGYTGTFSPFAVGDDVVLLPVSWLHFDCSKRENQGAQLNWSTASEQNTKRFVVERSQNGQVFEPIGTIPAAGYSQSIRQYSFTDASPLKAAAYYRVAMEENNGHREYSSICMNNGTVTAENNPVNIHPNPSSGTVNIYCPDGGNYQIYDRAGRLVKSGTLKPDTRIEGLISGVYFITVQTSDNHYTQKLLVE